MISFLKGMVKAALEVSCKAVSPFFSKKCHIKQCEARQTLEKFHPKSDGIPNGNNELLAPVCDLQIIVPAYNVEKYLKKCIDSILAQKSKYTFKVILVDDGSTDGTSEIADGYIGDDRVQVIHKENAGLSGARNQGLKMLYGRYVMFVDSDDELCPGAIEALMDVAMKYDCDIVEGGAYYLNGDNKSSYFSHSQVAKVNSAEQVLHGVAWAKVFRSQLFEKLIFPENYWFEDSIFSFMVYTNKIAAYVCDEIVYAYRVNRTGSIIHSYSNNSKALDTYWITETLMEVRRNMGYSNDQLFFERFLRQIKLNQKRIIGLPKTVQQSVFVLSAELLSNAFSEYLIEKNRHKLLVRALLSKKLGYVPSILQVLIRISIFVC